MKSKVDSSSRLGGPQMHLYLLLINIRQKKDKIMQT